MTMSSGVRSPPLPRSSAASPRPKFDSGPLKVYMKKLLSTTLQGGIWSKDNAKIWMKDIGERVKERMLEIQPRGFKYIVLSQINENRGQGARADIVCHWEDTDVVAEEVFYDDCIICICIALAIACS